MTSLTSGKKILLGASVLLLLTAGMGAVFWGSTETGDDLLKPRSGSDFADLSGPRPKTGLILFGSVQINRQFPLGTGYVVAYDEMKTRAVAYSHLDKFGNFKLTNVPPGPLHLLVKKEITDEPNDQLRDSMIKQGITDQPRSHSKAEQPRRKKTGSIEPPGVSELQQLLAKQPSKREMDNFRSNVFVSEFADHPTVHWMVEMAFLKFGEFSDKHSFLVPEGDGERSLMMNLKVP